jgi:hypothetical protein
MLELFNFSIIKSTLDDFISNVKLEFIEDLEKIILKEVKEMKLKSF